jgi:hypothetical protein
MSNGPRSGTNSTKEHQMPQIEQALDTGSPPDPIVTITYPRGDGSPDIMQNGGDGGGGTSSGGVIIDTTTISPKGAWPETWKPADGDGSLSETSFDAALKAFQRSERVGAGGACVR